MYDTLLYEFNAAHWTDELVFSERDLIQLTGLAKTTLNRAKHFLASKGYIRITRGRSKTIYALATAERSARPAERAVERTIERTDIGPL